METTPRWGLRTPSLEGDAPDVPFWMQRLATDLDDVAKDSQGSRAERPSTSEPGRYYWATDQKVTYRDSGTSWDRVGAPAGSIVAYAGLVAPDGYVICDGAAVPRSGAHLDLWFTVGTYYGTGDGSTTFNLPDLRGRVPVGADGSANRLDANDTIGAAGGSQKHALTLNELPSHYHDGPFVKGISFADGSFAAGGSYAINNATITGGSVTASAGGNQPHNNMQPYLIVNYAIKL